MENKNSIGTNILCHVAILVKDIRKAVDNWAAILGVEKPNIWNLPDAKTVPSFTRGESGDYTDCQLAVFDLENAKIELCQPGQNPSPWKEALEKYGEGVQHVSFVVPDRDQANRALEGIGVPPAYHIGYWPTTTYAFFDSKEQLGVEINIKTDEDNTEKIASLIKHL